MGEKSSTTAYAIGAAVVAGGLILGFATLGDGDDGRPPIIVRNGSLIFEATEGVHSNGQRFTPEWVRDTIGEQWKPDHTEGKHVRTFEVTLTNFTNVPQCAAGTLSGDEVVLQYRASARSNPIDLLVYRRRKLTPPALGRIEPKIDSPEELTASPASGSTPPRLRYDDGSAGYVSRITVGTNPPCDLPAPADDTERLAREIRIAMTHNP